MVPDEYELLLKRRIETKYLSKPNKKRIPLSMSPE
jgi:hypothetical protein